MINVSSDSSRLNPFQASKIPNTGPDPQPNTQVPNHPNNHFRYLQSALFCRRDSPNLASWVLAVDRMINGVSCSSGLNLSEEKETLKFFFSLFAIISATFYSFFATFISFSVIFPNLICLSNIESHSIEKERKQKTKKLLQKKNIEGKRFVRGFFLSFKVQSLIFNSFCNVLGNLKFTKAKGVGVNGFIGSTPKILGSTTFPPTHA